MKHARFLAGGRIQHGAVSDDGTLLDAAGRRVHEEGLVWLPPVAPPKVIGLALNFADHAAELELKTPEAPALFLKPLTSLTGHKSPVIAPPNIEYMHYEVELVVVIGSGGRRITRDNAYEHVKGYTIGNDVTIRDFVGNLYRPPVKAKGFDTFTPLGPWMIDRDDLPNPNDVTLRAYVNGELRQEGNTRNFVNDIPALIEYISDFMTLEEDDLIFTGTPKGLSHIYPGDTMRLEIEGIGALENPVVAE
ncbi:MAG TPA: fumarylacetoacetate hydrolase family protein [Thermomicrobiales bacterium]|nr:fumarylacetoacetate hydrolase family protein [Thermomicrobiales bacterium]